MALQRKRPEASAVQLKHVTELVEVCIKKTQLFGVWSVEGNGTTWWLVVVGYILVVVGCWLLLAVVVVVTAEDVTYLLFKDGLFVWF